jgi:hemerythrin
MKKTSDIIWQDKQHQVLFEVLDEIAEGQGGALVLEKLKYYAENHFAIEETYMQKLDYPHIEAHIRAHDQFRQELGVMVNNGSQYDDRFARVLSTFLTEWLKRHIFGIDKKLEDFILQSSVK